MESDVDYDSHRIEHKISERMIQDHGQSFQKCRISNKFIAKRLMPRQIREHSHCFDLYFLVLCSKNIELDAVKYGDADVVI